jgi:protein phosphatase
VGLVVLLIAAAGLGAGYAWTRSQYFVGASDGQVAIFQGLPDGIPGLPLSQVYEVQELPVASLPPYYQAQVTAGIEVASLEAAHATVEQLREAARRCAEPSATPKPTPSTTPKPTGSASPRQSPSTGASASASVTAAPRPTPSTSTTPLPGQGC